MSSARFWDGSRQADTFIFRNDYDRFDLVKAGNGWDIIADGKNDGYWSSDKFFGQAGNDTLISNDGDDMLFGNMGADTFIVHANWYDPAEVQFPWQPVQDHDVVGFNVDVFGGKGEDTLIVKHSDGYTLEHHGNATIIHTAFGGTITARGIEDFEFL